MLENAYSAPNAELERGSEKLSAAEKLAQSRRDMQESSAITKLNLVWGLRFTIDVALMAFFLFSLFSLLYQHHNLDTAMITGFTVIFVYLVFEITSIVAYFRRLSWCVIPLHISSSLSLLNFPFGTILSLIHFFNMGKIQFDRHS